MEQRKKIERLAKAMGWEWFSHGWMTSDGVVVAKSGWNPWENPADLRPVFQHIESIDFHYKALFEKIMDDTIGVIWRNLPFVYAATYFLTNPHWFADAALAVLEGE